MTAEQRQTLMEDLAEVKDKLSAAAMLTAACYGPENRIATRAEEAAAAVQRLEWELERFAIGETAK
jgi:hypothetical protein